LSDFENNPGVLKCALGVKKSAFGLYKYAFRFEKSAFGLYKYAFEVIKSAFGPEKSAFLNFARRFLIDSLSFFINSLYINNPLSPFKV
jgi:hypothetical protein